MAYNTTLADRIREFLAEVTRIKVAEKTMFRGLAFIVNGKMCVNVSGDNLMCRFDPAIESEVSERRGFLPMIMKGKQLKGYCYVSEEGYHSKRDFDYWINLCLAYNDTAKASIKKKPTSRKRTKTD